MKFPPWWGYGYFLELHIFHCVSIVKRSTFMKFAMCCSTHYETLPTHSKIITAHWKAFQRVERCCKAFSVHFGLISYAGFSQIGSQLTLVTMK